MRKEIWIGLVAALIIAGILSPFASPNPDGLEKVAETKGFIDKGEGKEVVRAPIPDYVMPGLASEGVATAFAGITGTVVTFVAAYGIGRLVQRRKAADSKG
ncbi:MAG: PDGLE domain-containing protein [Bacillota bacterium]|nr:PDGLE domain-containing protein [Thermoanaerobacteraceae bacterium]